MTVYDDYLEGYKEKGVDFLRENVPEVQKFEACDVLTDLRLIKDTDMDVSIVLHYVARAPSLIPSVRKKLIELGLAKQSNMMYSSVRNKGTEDEVYSVTMGFYGKKLQINLNLIK